MSVKVHLHPFLIHMTDNQDTHEVNGTTVGECLEDLVRRYPDLDEWLFTEDRELNNLFEAFVNMQSNMKEGLRKRVRDGDDINLVIIIAGG